MTGFARGADISWVTEMELAGRKFYTADGQATDCFELMKLLGMNAVRLRVWVNPADGWCNEGDVVIKAFRAKQAGLRVMIDFHYSDVWADPDDQHKPVAWQSLSLEELKTAIADHTKSVLNALKERDIAVEWVQVGNEVSPGILWDTDAAVSGASYDYTKDGVTYRGNEANFAAFLTVGSEATKEVFPDAKVVIHVENGHNNGRFRRVFDILEAHKVPYDVIGMSLYPTAGEWQNMVTLCGANMRDMISRYGKEVMLAEVGMPYDDPQTAFICLTALRAECEAIPQCLGIFYWEPEAYGGWKGYSLGAFDNNGRPTVALDAFKAN
jgi:arabinogalactan endo-1,4-beta-galactosidase